MACRELRKGSLPLVDDKLKHIGHLEKYLFRTPEMQDQLLGNILQILYYRAHPYNAEVDP